MCAFDRCSVESSYVRGCVSTRSYKLLDISLVSAGGVRWFCVPCCTCSSPACHRVPRATCGVVLVMEKETTDYPARVPRTPAEFAEVGKVLPSADYERLNKPYQPLPEGCVLERLVALRYAALRAVLLHLFAAPICCQCF